MAAKARIAGLTMTDFIVARCARDVVSFDLRSMPGQDSEAVSGRRARPRHAGAARTEQMNVRCTPDERAIIEDRAKEAGITLSDYVVASALGNRIERIVWDDEGVLKEVTHELKKQGVNLNQIALIGNKLNLEIARATIDQDKIDLLTRELEELYAEGKGAIADAMREVRRTLAMLNSGKRARG